MVQPDRDIYQEIQYIRETLSRLERLVHQHFGLQPGAHSANTPHPQLNTGQTYTPTNVTTDRTYDADTVVVAELADIVGTLIADLQTIGVLN